MQKMTVIHCMQKKSALPARLLQCKTKLLPDTAVLNAFFSKQNGFILAERLANTIRQRNNPYQLDRKSVV